MAIGKFYAYEIPKQRKSPKIKPEKIKPERKRKIKAPAPEEVKITTNNNSLHQRIVVFGRSQQAILDFLCAAYNNLAENFIGMPLSVHTEDSKTLAAVSATEKELKLYFQENHTEDRFLSNEGFSEPENYSFEISVPDEREKSLYFDFCCVTTAGADITNADAVWILLDAELYDDGANVFGNADESIRRLLSGADSARVPYMLIATQFEHKEKYNFCRTFLPVTYAVSQYILETVRARYGSFCSNISENTFILFSQIYGGLVFSHINEAGEIAQNNGKGHSFYDYRPLACHNALLRTIEFLNKNGQLPECQVCSLLKQICQNALTAQGISGEKI